MPIEEPRFTINEGLWPGSRSAAPALWEGKLISGRYAQNGDPHQGIFERLTDIPKSLRSQPDYPNRGSLPHHDEIAVDEESMSAGHRLYLDPAGYPRGFRERRAAAIAHLHAVYQAWA